MAQITKIRVLEAQAYVHKLVSSDVTKSQSSLKIHSLQSYFNPAPPKKPLFWYLLVSSAVYCESFILFSLLHYMYEQMELAKYLFTFYNERLVQIIQ